jgi:hypothetical protein
MDGIHRFAGTCPERYLVDAHSRLQQPGTASVVGASSVADARSRRFYRSNYRSQSQRTTASGHRRRYKYCFGSDRFGRRVVEERRLVSADVFER